MRTSVAARVGSISAATALFGALVAMLALMRVAPMQGFPADPGPTLSVQQAIGPLKTDVIPPPKLAPPPAQIVVDAPVSAPLEIAVSPAEGPPVPSAFPPAASGPEAHAPVIETARPIGAPPRPNYPPRALAYEKAGAVQLRLTIGIDGAVTDVAVVTETPEGYGFAAAAVSAVRRIRFEPKRVDGAAVAGEFGYTVRFQLE